MRIAVLGLGRMGQALVLRLHEQGHVTIVWNRTKSKADAVVSEGAIWADSPAEAVEEAEVVMTSLSDDKAVRDLALGPRGLSSFIGSRSYLDTSTVSPALSAELGRAFDRFLALPILGAPQAVRSGNATYLAGGDEQLIIELDPLLKSLSEKVLHYERPEMAASAKLAVNLLLLSAAATLAESFTIARAGGLRDDQLEVLFADSPMVAPGLKNRFQALLAGSGPTWWTTALGAKDAGLAVEAARSKGVDLEIAPVVRDLYRKAAEQGWRDEDIVAVAKLYDEQLSHRAGAA